MASHRWARSSPGAAATARRAASLLWQRLLGRPASEYGRIMSRGWGPRGGRVVLEGANVAYALAFSEGLNGEYSTSRKPGGKTPSIATTSSTANRTRRSAPGIAAECSRFQSIVARPVS